MQYQHVEKGSFIRRPNRFIAHVEIEGKETVCHVKNTGRCKELLIPGCTVYLEKSDNPNRKTAYDLIAVEKGERLINMDAQAPNRVFAEFAGTYLPNIKTARAEVQFGQSRLDFCLDTDKGFHYVEVKGVTLEKDGKVYFPDAPTERGVKHLHELMRAVREGHEATVFFVIQMENVKEFSPNTKTHPAFVEALRQAQQAGVHIAAYCCKVCPSSMQISHKVPVNLWPSFEEDDA